jgi:hypothetical protein
VRTRGGACAYRGRALRDQRGKAFDLVEDVEGMVGVSLGARRPNLPGESLGSRQRKGAGDEYARVPAGTQA